MTVTVKNKTNHNLKATYHLVKQIIILELYDRKYRHKNIESSVAFILDMPKIGGTATFDYHNWTFQIEEDY